MRSSTSAAGVSGSATKEWPQWGQYSSTCMAGSCFTERDFEGTVNYQQSGYQSPDCQGESTTIGSDLPVTIRLEAIRGLSPPSGTVRRGAGNLQQAPEERTTPFSAGEKPGSWVDRGLPGGRAG